MISEVTHEMPAHVVNMLMREVSRVLRPGGVVGYLDLNPSQILKDNTVANLVSRIAIANEPYLDDYLENDINASFSSAGLELLDRTWPNRQRYATEEACSLRIIVAR